MSIAGTSSAQDPTEVRPNILPDRTAESARWQYGPSSRLRAGINDAERPHGDSR